MQGARIKTFLKPSHQGARRGERQVNRDHGKTWLVVLGESPCAMEEEGTVLPSSHGQQDCPRCLTEPDGRIPQGWTLVQRELPVLDRRAPRGSAASLGSILGVDSKTVQ